jgi:2-oxoglutarate dehydrogenase E2 component (dihydrolipoamide succinyltransferase)
MAEANGVALSEITGTGVGGRIRKQDVLAAAEAKKAAAPAAPATSAPAAAAAVAPSPDAAKRGTTEKMSRLRATIAKRMVESLQVSAQLTATVEVDLTNVAKLRAKVKDEFAAREGVGLTYLAFIAKATTEALKQFPKVNATIDTEAGTITYADAEHLGIAVDTERGLLVPVIANAGDLSVPGLAKKIADLGARTRNNQVTPDELSGGTFTITNYGSAGTLFDTPIINQPQAAILGTGALVKRPMVVNDPKLGQIIAVRDMMYLSLSYDHRLVDGADAARFLSFLKARLETGDFGSELGR